MKLNYKEFKILLSSYKDIVWDYDDTLSNTVMKKGDAYVDLFKNYPDEFKNFIKKDHQSNPGVSRFRKIPYYICKSKDYLNIEIDEKLTLLKFSELCIQILINEPLINEFEEFIKNEKIKCKHHILTNMPQDKIDKILFYKKINHRFENIKGGALDKSINLQKLVKKFEIPKKIIFIGDSEGDLLAAKNNKIDFVLRSTNLNQNIKRDFECNYVEV